MPFKIDPIKSKNREGKFQRPSLGERFQASKHLFLWYLPESLYNYRIFGFGGGGSG